MIEKRPKKEPRIFPRNPKLHRTLSFSRGGVKQFLSPASGSEWADDTANGETARFDRKFVVCHWLCQCRRLS